MYSSVTQINLTLLRRVYVYFCLRDSNQAGLDLNSSYLFDDLVTSHDDLDE